MVIIAQMGKSRNKKIYANYTPQGTAVANRFQTNGGKTQREIDDLADDLFSQDSSLGIGRYKGMQIPANHVLLAFHNNSEGTTTTGGRIYFNCLNLEEFNKVQIKIRGKSVYIVPLPNGVCVHHAHRQHDTNYNYLAVHKDIISDMIKKGFTHYSTYKLTEYKDTKGRTYFGFEQKECEL